MLKVIFAACLSASTLFAAAEAPAGLEAYGDSITAGFLSKYPLDQAPSLKTIGEIMTNLLRYKLTNNFRFAQMYEQKTKAWPVYVAAQKWNLDASNVYNYAKSGARVTDLLRQVGLSQQRENTVSFFFIGHNDLCKNPKRGEDLGKDVVADYEKGLTSWDGAHHNSTAYLVPVSHVDQVFDVLRDVTWQQTDQGSYTCRDSWEHLFPYCARYTPMFLDGTLGAYLRENVTEVNRAIADLAGRMTSTNGNRFLYVRGAEDVQLQKDMFAIDCYHLSEGGQRTVGSLMATKLPE